MNDRLSPARRAAFLLAGLLPVAGAACARPPQERLSAAFSAMQRANQAGGIVRAPEPCAAAQVLLLHADAEVRLQAKRSFLSRDYDEAEVLVSQALIAAESCELHARAVRDLARDRARAALAEAEAWIGRAATLARHVPDEEGIKKELLRAEIALGEGRAGFEREQYDRAEEAAGRARAVVAGTVSEIARFVDRFTADPRRATWKLWVQETVRESRRTGRPAIVVDKLRRHLLLITGDEEIASYAADLGVGGIGYKTRSGDESTPEGRYRVTDVRAPGQTRYYRALMLDYPNLEDRARFRRLVRSGRLSRRQQIGGNIEIHGEGGRGHDWTQGCVALENGDMDDLVLRVRVGTPVTIVGMIPEGALP